MNSKEYTLFIPHDVVKQYISKCMYAVQSMRFNKIHNEMIDCMKTARSLQKSESLLDKFVYLIIKMLGGFKLFFVKSYFLLSSNTHQCILTHPNYRILS